MTTVHEDSNDKTKVPVKFPRRSVSLVFFAAELAEQIHNRCTCKLIKTSSAYLRTVFLCFCPFFLFVVLDIQPWKLVIIKQLFASGSVNIGEYSSIFAIVE